MPDQLSRSDISTQLERQSCVVMECTVPDGVTLDEWRRRRSRRASERRLSVRRLSAALRDAA